MIQLLGDFIPQTLTRDPVS